MATKKKTTATKKPTAKSGATMYNVSRFDDDGYGIHNLKLPGDKKKTTRKK